MRPLRMFSAVSRVFHTSMQESPQTEVLQVVNERTIIRVLDLAMRIGDSMLVAGASAHEVTVAVSRVARAYGLGVVHVNVTYTSITVSHHRSEDEWPTTLMRVIKSGIPDHLKLQRLQALLVDIEGGMPLDEARITYRAIRRTPFLYRSAIVLLSRAVLATGVAVMFGASVTIMALTFFAALCASLVQAAMARSRVPIFFTQIAGGFAVTAVAVLVSALGAAGIAPFTGVRASIIVSAGIMLMLAGMAVVGAAQDAIDGFALTATGRILDLTMQTLGVVLGILFGLEVGRVLGYPMPLPSEPLQFATVGSVLVGAVIASVSVAVYNGAGLRTLIASGLLSCIGIGGFLIATTLNLGDAVASGIGAFCASFVGALVAHRLHVPSVAVTTAAIIPLVPGAAVFRGLLAVVHSDGSTDGMLIAGGSLIAAMTIGLALATGASLGLTLGTPVRTSLASVTRSRPGVRKR